MFHWPGALSRGGTVVNFVESRRLPSADRWRMRRGAHEHRGIVLHSRHTYGLTYYRIACTGCDAATAWICTEDAAREAWNTDVLMLPPPARPLDRFDGLCVGTGLSLPQSLRRLEAAYRPNPLRTPPPSNEGAGATDRPPTRSEGGMR